MGRATRTHANCRLGMMGNLSFFLGGKTAEDGHRWCPNFRAVRAVINLW
ncbi:hypothetical protein FOPG_19481 [Fusarium oxysporum f. sp. conglutinans race 2 54008]|uniref:Uncharacterized protein n=1 Tax=Fusarium oxysporum f. sp. conglutinans race 2 54008 TaxID=1089457 RepID=X0GKV4_FUSOX|nr:hypothetical protein FOPG_19481 [Fusarium oxysporum f. sp. conglutinans race 2 54008]